MTDSHRAPWSRIIGFGAMVLAAAALIVAQLIVARAEAPLTATAFGVYATLGGLIVFRRDGHLTGWMLTAVGLAVVSADGLDSIPGVPEVAAAWLNSWEWSAVFALFITLIATFPSGRAPRGPGLARLGRITLWSLPFLVATGAFTLHLSGPVSLEEIDNPVGFLPDWVGIAGLLVIVGLFVASVASLVIRRRSVTGQERAQFTWVMFAAALLIAAIVFAFLWIATSIAIGNGDPGDEPWVPTFLMMLLFPISFGVAILRYRLFEIDRIISRTVTYSLVIASLAAVYLVVVTTLTTLLPADSDLAVAASTLAAVLLFNPLRRNIQHRVERRFNRGRYDAKRIADRFALSLHARSDPNAVMSGWAAVVSETMQPGSLGVWLRRG